MYWPLMHSSITWRDKYELIKFIVFSDRFTNGPKVREFEEAWSKWIGAKYSLYVSSGSTANSLLMASVKELYKIPNGAKVLVPACTWVTNISPVIQCGLEPVFCDISLENFSFDIEKLPKDDVAIVFVTHLLGIDAPVEALKERYPNAIFLEDICESHGVEDPLGVRRGGGVTAAAGSTFSFYYGHHMTTIEGGFVSTNDKELYEFMRMKRSHGMAREMSPDYYKMAAAKFPDIDGRFLFLTDGHNFRNTEIGAVLGLSQLKRLENSIEIRRENFKFFVEELKKLDDHFYIPKWTAGNSSFCLPLICKDAKLMPRLKKSFEEAGIENRPIVGGNLLRQPFLAKYKNVKAPNADILNDQGVYVGNSQFVTIDMVHKLIDIVRLNINEAYSQPD
jgi:CDP-6-deoxy-D-xylo-4-hexulose-3-dehydrase